MIFNEEFQFIRTKLKMLRNTGRSIYLFLIQFHSSVFILGTSVATALCLQGKLYSPMGPSLITITAMDG